MCVYTYIYIYIYLSIYLSTYLSIHLSIPLSLSLSRWVLQLRSLGPKWGKGCRWHPQAARCPVIVAPGSLALPQGCEHMGPGVPLKAEDSESLVAVPARPGPVLKSQCHEVWAMPMLFQSPRPHILEPCSWDLR